MTDRVIKVAHEFSPTPIGRYRWQSKSSGEAFREDLLSPAIREFENIVVDLDETSGLSTGFLDEAFAGIVREKILSAEEFLLRVTYSCTDDPLLVEDIRSYIDDARRKLG